MDTAEIMTVQYECGMTKVSCENDLSIIQTDPVKIEYNTDNRRERKAGRYVEGKEVIILKELPQIFKDFRSV